MSIKTVFLGSNHEALKTLIALNEHTSFDVVAVITQPDKPVGRKQEIVETEIRKYCIEKKLNIFYTNNNEEKYKEALELFKPELVVCKSFGEIIPEFFLKFPKYESINIHFSLLPKYRGAVPIQMAILNGDSETGISIIKMTHKLDNGEIIAQFKEKINGEDTNVSLRERLVRKTAQELPEILINWVEGKIKAVKQDDSKATYCWKKDISKEKAEIDWERYNATKINRMVRALVPWPVAWTTINGKKTKIFLTEINSEIILKPGDFIQKDNSLFVGTKEGTIEILRLQMEGKKVMEIKELLNGVQVASIQ